MGTLIDYIGRSGLQSRAIQGLICSLTLFQCSQRANLVDPPPPPGLPPCHKNSCNIDHDSGAEQLTEVSAPSGGGGQRENLVDPPSSRPSIL